MSSSDNSSNFPNTATPALLKSTVTRPCCAPTSSANAFIRVSSATFTICCVTFPLGDPSSAAVSANPFSSTSEIASDAHVPANCCARHRPIPDPAPVITATPSLKNPIGTPSRLDLLPCCPKLSCAQKSLPHRTTTTIRRKRPAPLLHLGIFRLLLGIPDAHRVASTALRFVQHLVGLAHQSAKLRRLLAGTPGNAKTRSHVHHLPLKRKRKRRKLFPKPVHRRFDMRGFHVRHHQQKFIPAQPPANIRRPCATLQIVCERFDHYIPGLMTES